MSRLLWFVLGGIATAVGAGVAAVMLDEEQKEESVADTDADQRDLVSKDEVIQEDNVGDISEM